MKRFHRAVWLTFLVLASLILVIELFRAVGLYPRVVVTSTLAIFCATILNLSAKFSQSFQRSPSSEDANV